MQRHQTDQSAPKQMPPPQFPLRPAIAVLAGPLFVTGLFVIGFGRWQAPAAAYAVGTSLFLMALCICSPEILAFPVNARGELKHRLELARCAGTSWFSDIRAQGRCALLEMGEAALRVTQQRDQFAALFGIGSAFYLVLGLAVLAGALQGWLALSGSIWACFINASAFAYFCWLAVTYRHFGPLAPDKLQVLEAAKLHLRCDEERSAELIGLIKKA